MKTSSPSPLQAPTERAHGFTLLEVLAVTAILAILSSLAVPAFDALVASIRARGASGELHAALTKARTEAIKRNAEVTLAPAANGPWQGGWRIRDPRDAGRALEDHAAVPGATITGPAQVTFLANGRVKGGAQPSFDIAVAGSRQHRCIAIDLGGHASQGMPPC
jgi:type IV fimbrial biogenesis protein FimT